MSLDVQSRYPTVFDVIPADDVVQRPEPIAEYLALAEEAHAALAHHVSVQPQRIKDNGANGPLRPHGGVRRQSPAQ